MRGDKMAKRSSFGKTIRKRLSDITNYQPNLKSEPLCDQILPPDNSLYSAKNHIDHLLKIIVMIEQENAELMKLITDKNKVIEVNGAELQKLRIVVQKTQLQNWNLAQSNSHMMAELNLGKQKLKTLQHQLTCKDALLKTMNQELQEHREINDRKGTSQVGDNPCTEQQNANKCTRPTRSQSHGPWMTTTDEQVSDKEKVENKRRCVRRQTARFRSQEKENLFEIEDVNMDEGGQTSVDQKESQRMSFGRPSRRAAEKVQSYKETSLKIKMRRPE
ncbi:hypothetical protein LXL04_004568 [Taraxacum kok-saghyz]